MTPADLEFSIACTVLAAFVFAGIVALVLRQVGRDQEQHDDVTSEGLDREGRAVTTIHGGDWVRHK